MAANYQLFTLHLHIANPPPYLIYMHHLFNHIWTIKDAIYTQDKGKVFSCFSCGGGSTMGYKLAGYDVLGELEIDPKIIETYIKNHKPKYAFNQGIKEFKNRNDLPDELFDLDILDGSPPCSSFSLMGTREKDWGKMKKFREGQAGQILDTLFFDYIDLAKIFYPKVVVSENVTGILLGNAEKYLKQIYKEFDEAGYYLQHFILDSSKMGVPQSRERVFFIGLRKDLAKPFLYKPDFFTTIPKLDLYFNEPEIPFRDIESFDEKPLFKNPSPVFEKYWEQCYPGEHIKKYHEKGSFHGTYKVDPEKPLLTIISHPSKGRGGPLHYNDFRMLTRSEVYKAQTFPLDYECNDPYYICGMSVPPVMMAQISKQIYDQWLSKI